MGLTHQPNTRYTCQRCGSCCDRLAAKVDRSWVEALDVEALYTERPDLRSRPLFMMMEDEEGEDTIRPARDGHRLVRLELAVGE